MDRKGIPAVDASEDLAEQARPLDGPNLIDVPVSDITLPPENLVDELDNQSGTEDVAPRQVEVATLDFCGDALPWQAFPLTYPFRWQGERVDTVTVRQLTTAQMGQIVGRFSATGRGPDLMDIYAEMCGLPVAVLRALPATDGDPILDKAWDFLPPSLRPATG